jgi:hypothetical protein
MVDAIIEEADPLNVLRRYEALATAGQEILRTDVPRELMPAFVDLALKVKERKVRSIAFVTSDHFFSGDPDYPWMRSVVARALGPHTPSGHREDPGTPVAADDACGYLPVG